MRSAASEIITALGGRNGVCCCPAHDDKNPSLSVIDSEDGDVIVHCFSGCDYRDIKDELRHRGLLPNWQPSDSDPVRQAILAAEHSKRDAAALEKNRQRGEWCLSIWKESEDAKYSPVEVYLASRGIHSIPPTIRYHANLRHSETKQKFPAMVSAVTCWPDRDVVGIHRTYIHADGRGKANVFSPKKMAGVCKGGSVRLALATIKLGLAEGIETALSVQQVTKVPMWACLSTSGMRSVIIPKSVSEILIFADGDNPGLEAARHTAKRFITNGKSVRIIPAPMGRDWNDCLNILSEVLEPSNA